MLRRPIGLLPTATTRASAAPEMMGHVTGAVCRDGLAQMPDASANTVGRESEVGLGRETGPLLTPGAEVALTGAAAKDGTLTTLAATAEPTWLEAATEATSTECGRVTSMVCGRANAMHVACAGVILPVVRAEAASTYCAMNSRDYSLMQVSAVPLARGQNVAQANALLSWGEVVQARGASTVCDAQLAKLRERTAVVETGRARSLARRQVTHFKCLCCRSLILKAEGSTCSKCGFTQPESSQLAISEREAARAAARSNTKDGRRRNSQRAANVPQHSLAVAPVSAFEQEWQAQLASKKQKIADETDALAMARCGLAYVETEDTRAAVLESFVQVRIQAIA